MRARLLSQVHCSQGAAANEPLKCTGSQFLSDQRFCFHKNLSPPILLLVCKSVHFQNTFWGKGRIWGHPKPHQGNPLAPLAGKRENLGISKPRQGNPLAPRFPTWSPDTALDRCHFLLFAGTQIPTIYHPHARILFNLESSDNLSALRA